MDVFSWWSFCSRREKIHLFSKIVLYNPSNLLINLYFLRILFLGFIFNIMLILITQIPNQRIGGNLYFFVDLLTDMIVTLISDPGLSSHLIIKIRLTLLNSELCTVYLRPRMILKKGSFKRIDFKSIARSLWASLFSLLFIFLTKNCQSISFLIKVCGLGEGWSTFMVAWFVRRWSSNGDWPKIKMVIEFYISLGFSVMVLWCC